MMADPPVGSGYQKTFNARQDGTVTLQGNQLHWTKVTKSYVWPG